MSNESPILTPIHMKAGESAGGGSAHEERSTASEQRRRELADFLRTRREKLKPEQVGITQLSRRRTPGLRREEVAELAGVGTTWYTWLEQARDIQPSGEVLRRLGQALNLNPAEMRHMFALAGKALPPDIDAVKEEVTPSLRRLLDHGLSVPAIVLGQRWDVIGYNKAAEETLPDLMKVPADKRNWLYFVFCTEGPRANLEQWESNARRLIAEFRASLGDLLDNPWVHELVEQLKTESPEFGQWWKDHDVRDRRATVIQFSHPTKGQVVAERSVFKSDENPKLTLMLFTPVK